MTITRDEKLANLDRARKEQYRVWTSALGTPREAHEQERYWGIVQRMIAMQQTLTREGP